MPKKKSSKFKKRLDYLQENSIPLQYQQDINDKPDTNIRVGDWLCLGISILGGIASTYICYIFHDSTNASPINQIIDTIDF